MTIGFDLDKIFINTPPLIPNSIIQRLYGQKINGKLVYRIPSQPEQVFRKMTHHPLFRPPIKSNLNFLKSISKENNKLYLISSRYGFLKKETNQVITHYGLDKIFDGLYFNFSNEQPHVFKNKLLKELHLDIYVDDDLSLLQYVAKDNPKTKFFWLETDEYAHALKQHKNLHPNVVPIRQLAHIFS